MEYKVIRAWDYDVFYTDVNKAINAGWILQGGVSTSEDQEQVITYAQALVREKEGK